MDIDKMFKMPKLPSKRKLTENPSPEMLKRLKVEEAPAPVITESKGKTRAVTIEDEPEDGDVSMDTSFAPGGDPDYFAEEDEDGRFYGGGLSSQQKEIMNIFDKAGGEGVQEDTEELTPTSIRRLLTRFERAVLKNQDQRSKYPDDPTKFIDSEADLDAALKSLLPLAQVPVLAYPELVKSGTIVHLIGLLSHENLDIVIDVVEVVHELTDEDVGNEEDVDEEEERTAEDALKLLIQGLLDNSILELLVDNLTRLNEEEESDRQGLFHILGIFENTLGFDPALSAQLVTKTTIMSWLLNRVQASKHDENRGYSAELLSILLQNNQSNRLEFGKKDGVETFLKVLSQYRRKEPADADEGEFMENVFDALCSAVSEQPIKELFLKAEGPDLMILMMKERNHTTSLAIKTMDYAMSGPGGSAICEAFIEALGLKALFSAFMGKSGKKSKSATLSSEDTTHILGIMLTLFSSIPSESVGRIRLLAKFVEGNYEKVDKLLEIRDNAKHRLISTDAEIEAEKKEMIAEGEEPGEVEEELWYLRKLEGGQFTLQSVDYILAWVIMEDDGIRAHVTQMLNRRNNSITDIVNTLKLYHDNVGDEGTLDDPDTLSQKEILRNLIDVLEKL